MEEIIINLTTKEDALKQIKKYLRKDQKYKIKLKNNLNNTDCSKQIEELVEAFNIKDIRKRYIYIYDTVCDYLDEKFQRDNICDFKNNKCIAVREGGYFENNCGCCYGPKRGKCKYLINNKCTIKSISCKLFTCRYLKKNNTKFLIKDIPLLNIFFNYKQKYIISYSIFTDKEEMIKRLLKAR